MEDVKYAYRNSELCIVSSLFNHLEKHYDLQKNHTEHKMCFMFLCNFYMKHFFPAINTQKVMLKIHAELHTDLHVK
jgi:hypothetical protein